MLRDPLGGRDDFYRGDRHAARDQAPHVGTGDLRLHRGLREVERRCRGVDEGDAAGAKALATEVEKTNPSNTILKLYWLPTVNAASELSRGNSSQALVDLEAAAPYELGGPPRFCCSAR